MIAVVDPHHILQRWRKMAHEHAKKYRSWGMSASEWENRARQLRYNLVLPARELDAIARFVWHL